MLGLPLILKPVVACGLPDSHSMALAVTPAGLLWALGKVPMPAIAQEFVNHSGRVFKVYVMGERVFHTVRPSIPNLDDESCNLNRLGLGETGAITFDSLKTLPSGDMGSLPHSVS